MFEDVETYAGDPILNLATAFASDPRSQKTNLSIGVYCDEDGATPTLRSVLHADIAMPTRDRYSPTYLPMEGLPRYRQAIEALLFGQNSEVVRDGRVATIQTLGGSGALKVGADFIQRYFPASSTYVSDHTWDNHSHIFQGAGSVVFRYRYFDRGTKGVDFDGMCEDLQNLPERSVIVLHPSCHNPTGADLTPEQWDRLVPIIQERCLIPFLDIAYQGFGAGIEEDAYAIRAFANSGLVLFVSTSFSKIFSLYNERVGALCVVCESQERAKRVLGQLQFTVRRNYASPPATGANLILSILSDASLKDGWTAELNHMRCRLIEMRAMLRTALEQRRPGYDFSYLTMQRGMFSFTGLSSQEVNILRYAHGIYVGPHGRLCVAGLTKKNIDTVAHAFAEVVLHV